MPWRAAVLVSQLTACKHGFSLHLTAVHVRRYALPQCTFEPIDNLGPGWASTALALQNEFLRAQRASAVFANAPKLGDLVEWRDTLQALAHSARKRGSKEEFLAKYQKLLQVDSLHSLHESGARCRGPVRSAACSRSQSQLASPKSTSLPHTTCPAAPDPSYICRLRRELAVVRRRRTQCACGTSCPRGCKCAASDAVSRRRGLRRGDAFRG